MRFKESTVLNYKIVFSMCTENEIKQCQTFMKMKEMHTQIKCMVGDVSCPPTSDTLFRFVQLVRDDVLLSVSTHSTFQ